MIIRIKSTFFISFQLALIAFANSQDAPGLKIKSLGQVDFSNFFSFQDHFPEIYPFGQQSLMDDNSIDRMNLKLPTNLEPIYYRLKLIPNLESDENPLKIERFKAKGSVAIHINCLENTDEIHFHKRDLEIYEKTLKVKQIGSSLTELKVKSQEFESETDMYIIKMEDGLKKGGKYEVYIEFTSRVADDRLSGLYMSNYTDPKTYQTKYLATTQFESIDARSAFPCMDEPDKKAIFEISLGRKEKYNTLSNMQLIRTEKMHEMQGWYWDHYPPTLKMSTYLVAFIVSEFKSESADSHLNYPKPVKTWAAPHLIDKGGGIYAAKIASKILPFYDQFFGMEYPFPKMDSVAIPHFEAGAMENYGLNTYRIKALLYFEDESTESLRYGVTSTLAHELGHQNFGNLVTCKNWNNLWLNEGFATFVSYYGMKASAPELLVKNDWHIRVQKEAMSSDQKASAHPLVNQTVITSGMFDRITYSKGASMLIMMRQFLGEEVLIRGLQSYLKKFAFKNAVQDDFFAVIDEHAKSSGVLGHQLSIKQIMDTWTLQPGFPLIEIESEKNSTKTLHVTQKKFTNSDNSKSYWNVPLTMTSNITPQNNLKYWIHDTSPQIKLTHPAEMSWVIFNPDSEGYYRVKYNDHLSSLIQNQIKKDPFVFRPMTRCKLMDDAFHLGFAKQLDIQKALDLTIYMGHEREIEVWNTLFGNLRKPLNLLSGSKASGLIRDYFLPKIETRLNRIGWDQGRGERGQMVIHRAQLLSIACDFKHTTCLKYTDSHFSNFMNSRSLTPIPNDLRPLVLCTAIAHATQPSLDSKWNFLFQSYLNAPANDRKPHLLAALSCTREPNLLNKLLDEIILEKSIKKADVLEVLIRTTTNSEGRDTLFKFLREKFGKLSKLFGSPDETIQIISSLSNYWKTKEELLEFDAFILENALNLQEYGSALKSITANIEENIEWMRDFYEPINSWFVAKTRRV